MRDSGRSLVVAENPEGRGPFVILCDHASNRIPEAYQSFGFAEDALQTHIAWDPGALAVARLLSAKLDAPLFWPDASRLIIDCNRAAGCDRASSSPKAKGARCRPIAGSSEEERSRRLANIHAPFHDAIDACLTRRMSSGRPTALIAIHSFTPVYFGKARPWQVGILFDDDRRLADLLIGGLEADPAAHRRHQPTLFPGRRGLLHARPPCPTLGPAGGHDRNS